MNNSQTIQFGRLFALILPVIFLGAINLILRFDPNRRVVRPSQALKHYEALERGWSLWSLVVRVILSLFLADTVLAILAQTTPDPAIVAWLPAPLRSTSPALSAIYVALTFVAIWNVKNLKRLTVSIWDYVAESVLVFQDWRSLRDHDDFRPSLRLGNYRFRMKWWFKTNLEAVTSLQLRMILDAPTLTDFQNQVKNGDFPAAFRLKNTRGKALLSSRPWGLLLGPIKTIMLDSVAGFRRGKGRRGDTYDHGIFYAEPLWEIWQDQLDPQTNQRITTRQQMAEMLYRDLRATITCPACLNDEAQRATCERCAHSGAFMPPCPACKGKGAQNKIRCQLCDGLGLNQTPVPVQFLERLQYLWVARNADFVRQTFRVWLTNMAYSCAFALLVIIYLLTFWLSGAALTIDTLIQIFLFAGASLVGCVGAAIILVFGKTFNSSGTFYASFPLRVTKFGDLLWTKFMAIITALSFGILFIDTTLVLSQYFFGGSSDTIVYSIVAIFGLTLLALLLSVSGVVQVHRAMKDAKQSRLDELEHWLNDPKVRERNFDRSQEEDLFKEVREMTEWPIDGTVILGVISGIVLPLLLALASIATSSSFFSHLFH